jgi:hypothetical protein
MWKLADFGSAARAEDGSLGRVGRSVSLRDDDGSKATAADGSGTCEWVLTTTPAYAPPEALLGPWRGPRPAADM